MHKHNETNSSWLLTTAGARHSQPCTSTMARRACHFYQSPGGCRKGKNCQFAHIDSTSSSSRGSPGSPGPSAPRGNSSHPQPNAQSLAPIPPGVCRFFWTRGQCNREFGCRFRHDRPATAQATPPLPSPRSGNFFTSAAAKEIVAPFLTDSGLAKINSNATDGFFAGTEASSLSPTDAHRHLKRFLADNFKFKTSFDVYAFLSPLCSANSSNTRWVCLCLCLV